VIDLHLHTTASDGLDTPASLVARAAAAGVKTMAVTDHDTTAGIHDAAAACAAASLQLVPGIEVTAMESGRNIHILGYFIDPDHAGLAAFLSRQRHRRLERARAIAARLAEVGVAIDAAPLFAEATALDGRSLGRPQLARALVAAGHATDMGDAFERFLSRGRPAFVPRVGPEAVEVIAMLHDAGGLASLAHPVLAGVDARIPTLREMGLDAIEVYHSEHDLLTAERYLALARRLELLVTGGSDYHGDPAHGLTPGTVALPPREWERLSAWPRRSSR
jgi:predicted metal-dependent phosphoesterase TrpH